MEPRPAATVVIARSGDGGVEVLSLRRSATASFLPGFVVFPGGAVEPGDEPLAARLFGDAAESARACALRELYEEAGLLLTADGIEVRGRGGPISTLRFDPPAADALVEIGRWLAPKAIPVRFDATFFATGAPRGVDPIPDGAEVDRAWWASPAELLAAADDEPLMWPTRVTLEALARCETVADVLALRVEQVAPPR